MREQLSPLSADFVVLESVLAILDKPTLILGQDSTRLAIILSTPNAGTSVTVSTRGNVTINDGILVQSATLPLMLTFRDYGSLLSVPWYAFGNAFPVVLTVIAVQYRPAG